MIMVVRPWVGDAVVVMLLNEWCFWPTVQVQEVAG